MLPSQSALALFFIALVQLYSDHCCIVKGVVPMKRANFYLTEKQMERLHMRSEQDGVSVAELIRRAVDAFLSWDDPTYAPMPKPQTRNAHSSPA